MSTEIRPTDADLGTTTEAGNGHKASRARADVLELLVKAAGLVVVVLPLVGAGIRAIAFALDGLPDPIGLAAADPVQALAATTIKAVGPLVAVIAALGFLAFRGWTRPFYATRNLGPRWWQTWWQWWFGRWPQRVIVPLSLGFIGLFGVWPGGLLLYLSSGAAGYYLAEFQLRGQLTFYRLAAIAIAAGALSSVAAGMDGLAVGDEVNSYHFAATSGLSDGRYAVLGESDGIVYLDSCSGTGVVAVNIEQLTSFAPAQSKNLLDQSLFNWLFHGASLIAGYRRSC